MIYNTLKQFSSGISKKLVKRLDFHYKSQNIKILKADAVGGREQIQHNQIE
jgi:hypothetical protein